MIRNRILLRAIAGFLVLETLLNTVVPTISWALTAGPTAPEASTFEPVDTTDMVNLTSGDLTYNIPLIEVPGPSGGYPLSLSYHAGIQTNVDASWVGLGFSLNPGAINRSVSGYADDFNGLTESARTFWEGGQTTTYTVGVNVGYGLMPSASAGLTFSEDTYKGFGVGHYASFTAGGSNGALSLQAGIDVGVSPYGDSYSSTGVSGKIGISTSRAVGITSATGTAGWGFSITSENGGPASISSGGQYDYDISARLSKRFLGSTISTGKSGTSIGGAKGLSVRTQAHNSKHGNISTSGYNYTADIPTPWGFSVRLGKSYERYWIDETANVATHGALYFPSTMPSSSQLDSRAYDVYDLMDVNRPFSESIPDESLTGSFIDYDNYQVLAQGVSGTMRPYHFKSFLLRQNKKAQQQAKVMAYPLSVNSKPNFRFDGDFSNRYIHSTDDDRFYTTTSPDLPLLFEYDENRTTGESGSDGYDEEENQLPGSKSIKWFTNVEINDKDRVDENNNPIEPPPTSAIKRGFIDCKALGFKRGDSFQVGGFTITNESGVSYHYALPVYSFDEYTYSGNVDEKGKHSFNTYQRKTKYAYTWLLTAVTGSDFVDRNENGLADLEDWGYWVTFEYGKWSSKYGWRNPGTGFNKDIDQNFNNFSKGSKELYYLNSITTKTHTALFVKELRLDGKGVVHEMEQAVKTGEEHTIEGIDEGGFQKKTLQDALGNPYTEHPTSTLRLHSIYLLQNKDFTAYGELSNLSAQGNVYYHALNNIESLGKNTHGKNVIDIHDLANDPINTDLKTKSVKKIELAYDYSLCPETSNSFKSDVDVINTSETPFGLREGKLTLKSLQFLGKAESKIIPAMKFEYGDEKTFSSPMESLITSEGSIHRLTVQNFEHFNFKKGQLLQVQGERSRLAYAYITEVMDSEEKIDIKFFSNRPENSNGVLQFKTTTNPPFNEERYDLWGFHKADYVIDEAMSENERRRVTSISAQSTDAWSLTEITTSLGSKIKIEYEPDQYRNVLKSLSNISIKNVELTPDNKTRIILFENLAEYDLKEGDMINLRIVTALRYDVKFPDTNDEIRFNCGDDWYTYTYKIVADNLWNEVKIPIQIVGDNSFTINYNFTNGFPKGVNCISKYAPYDEVEGGNYWDCYEINDLLQVSAPIFLGGEVLTDKNFSFYGGGLRTKKITVSQFAEEASTIYEYSNGITPYEPLGFAMPIRKLEDNLTFQCVEDEQMAEIVKYRDKYIPDVYGRFQFLFANARELPGPGVMYELVTVREQIKRKAEITSLPGKTEYQFEVFSPASIDVENGNPNLGSPVSQQFSDHVTQLPLPSGGTQPVFGLPITKIETRHATTIQDFSAIMGSLKRITYYDANSKKISETKNHYLHDNFNQETFKNNLDIRYKNQGTIIETFADARVIINPDQNSNPPNYSLYGLISQKIKYPSIQTGQTVTNFKTGITTATENVQFDFYSGQVVKTKSVDGFGHAYITEDIPAYKIYTEMNQTALGGKNMLTQHAASYSYKVDGSNNTIGLLSATIQTWSNEIKALKPGEFYQDAVAQPEIWRKHANFNFIGDNSHRVGDGLYPVSDGMLPQFSAWDVNNPVPHDWIKTNEIMLYDVNSHALEVKDINNLYAANVMDISQSKLFASIANAKYNEFMYFGGEDYFDGTSPQQFDNKAFLSGFVSNEANHTGVNSLKSTGTGNTGFVISLSSNSGLRTGKYVFNVWVKTENPNHPKISITSCNANGSHTAYHAVNILKKSGEWYLMEAEIDLTGDCNVVIQGYNSSNGVLYWDDMRLHPLKAAMTSYVYNKAGELSHILDNNNLYTKFEYDGLGRLKHTYRETFTSGVVHTSEQKYHYARQEN